jgi:protein arginine N-methyltransferase 1
MLKLNKNTLLKRTPNTEILISTREHVIVKISEKTVSLPNHTLQLLSLFWEPLTIDSALTKMNVLGLKNWMDLTHTIKILCDIGVLAEKSTNSFISDINANSFSSAGIHIKMLNDKNRTNSFINAIKKIVQQDDVVVDIGTGTGILAIAAAKAGARKVYAIESGAIADVADETIKREGLSDVITLLRGWSTEVELPEKADVLISEILGNNPYNENILRTFKDAKERLIKPEARIIPENVQLFALPAMLSETYLKNEVVSEKYLTDWKDSYGINFISLNKIANQSRWLNDANFKAFNDSLLWKEPIHLCETDFKTFKESIIDVSIKVISEKPFNAMFLFFTSLVGESTITTSPFATERANHWLAPLRFMPEGLSMQQHKEFDLRFIFKSPRDTNLSLIKLS